MEMIQALQNLLHDRTRTRILAEATKLQIAIENNSFASYSRYSNISDAISKEYKELGVYACQGGRVASMINSRMNEAHEYYQKVLAEETKIFAQELSKYNDLVAATEELQNRIEDVEGAVRS